MDRKSILILALCFALILSWNALMNHFYPPPPPSAQPAAPANSLAASSNAYPSANTSAPGTARPVTPSAPKFVLNTNAPEKLFVLTNDNARYTFTSRGGGLKDIQLLHYPATIASRRNKGPSTRELATLNDGPVPPVFSLLGDDALLGDDNFTLTPIPNGVRATKTLSNGLMLVKTFELGTNYLLNATIRWENASKLPLVVPAQDWSIGAATPMDPKDNGQAEMVMWFDGVRAAGSIPLAYFDPRTSTMGIFPRTPKTEYVAGRSNVFWASAQNQFFSLATITGANTPAASISVIAVDLPAPTPEELAVTPGLATTPRAMLAAIHYPELSIPPGHGAEIRFNLFAGPKEYSTLARLAARFNNDIDLVMNFGMFGGIAKALLLTMNWLYAHVIASYGWIIIFITIVIKMVFWPLTRASTRSMKRMQALSPQLKELQAKYKDDPAKFSQKQWEFYKKNKVNPLGGCLPMLLQIPVFFGLLSMLRNAIELRGAHFLWMSDLSQPDTLFVLPLLGHNIPFNLMPIIMGGTQFWLMSLSPPSPGMDPAQQKMMRYMPLMFVFFLYSYSSGLALYWTVSNLLSVLQTKVTKTNPQTAGTTPAAPTAARPQKR